MKIYVSATYKDLAPHREAVLEALRRMGHQVIGMEDYVAEGARPLARCLADVESCDAYVGIFAWRYGFQPKFARPADAPKIAGTTPGFTSITEYEFRKAVEKKKPVLLFLLDQKAEWAPDNFDAITGEGEQGKRINALRGEMGQRYLVSYFRSPAELGALVSAAVYRAEMDRQMDLESIPIEAGLNRPFLRSGQTAMNDSALPAIQDVIAQAPQAIQIDIDTGSNWWMTRLYFLSSLAADLTNAEVMVFLGAKRSFIGVVSPGIVCERLLSAYSKVLRPYEQLLARRPVRAPDLRAEVHRRADFWQSTVGRTENASPVWVSAREVEQWFSRYMITQAIEWDSGIAAALQMQRLLDWPERFVPVVEKGIFQRMVDKQALTDQIARMFVREQVSRALSTVR